MKLISGTMLSIGGVRRERRKVHCKCTTGKARYKYSWEEAQFFVGVNEPCQVCGFWQYYFTHGKPKKKPQKLEKKP